MAVCEGVAFTFWVKRLKVILDVDRRVIISVNLQKNYQIICKSKHIEVDKFLYYMMNRFRIISFMTCNLSAHDDITARYLYFILVNTFMVAFSNHICLRLFLIMKKVRSMPMAVRLFY